MFYLNKIIFIVSGLFIALLAEVWRFIFIGEDTLTNNFEWILIILSYIIILFLGLYLNNKFKSHLKYYLLFGIFGVLIEFFILGTNPFEHIIIFLWVISFWGSIVLLPRLIYLNKIKRNTIFYFIFSFILFFIFYIFSLESSMLALFYINLNLPYILWEFNLWK